MRSYHCRIPNSLTISPKTNEKVINFDEAFGGIPPETLKSLNPFRLRRRLSFSRSQSDSFLVSLTGLKSPLKMKTAKSRGEISNSLI